MPEARTAEDDLLSWLRNPRARWNWDRYDCGPDDVFRQAITWIANDKVPPDRYVECGSACAKDGVGAPDRGATPKGLYRLTFLVRPLTVDFGRMYKACLFCFTSKDERFLVAVHLFKYELGLYFYCPREALAGRGSAFLAGHPGADNGWRCRNPDGLRFFELVTLAVRRRWPVYGGNDFEV